MTARNARSPNTPAPGEAPVRNARTLRPKDAATLILVDRTGPAPRILMGRRRASQVFLPNKFVFPGGRVDRCDRTMPALGDLPEIDRARLLHDMKGEPSDARARALGLTAIRETFEEAGLVVGTPPPKSHGRAAARQPGHKVCRRSCPGRPPPSLRHTHPDACSYAASTCGPGK